MPGPIVEAALRLEEIGRLEERERCAKIAEGFKPGFCGDDKDVLRYEMAEAIAGAIRSNR